MRTPRLLICTLIVFCIVGPASSSFAAVTEVVISAETIRDFGKRSPQHTAFVRDADASNGLAFKFTGGGWRPMPLDPIAWWEVEFWCDAGTYFIWANGKSDFNNGTDSFWLQFDDQLDTDDHTANPDWRGRGLGNWRDFARAGIYKWGRMVVTWTTKDTGLHIVRAQARETPHFLDQLLISQDREEKPRDRPWPTEFPRKDLRIVPRKDPRAVESKKTLATTWGILKN